MSRIYRETLILLTKAERSMVRIKFNILTLTSLSCVLVRYFEKLKIDSFFFCKTAGDRL